MIDFTILDDFPKYKELRNSQPYIADQDFNPVIINNVFNKDDMDFILQQIKSFPIDKIRVQKWGGQGVLDDIKISSDIRDKIQDLASKAAKQELVLAELSVVRYSPEYGYEVKLFPHYDTRPFEMFVFDVQIKSNADWGVIVEGKKFNLQDNQALLFSGTQQMHWRENVTLKDNAEVFMMFCWLKHKNPKPITKEQSSIMLERQKVLQQETNILSDEILRGGV